VNHQEASEDLSEVNAAFHPQKMSEIDGFHKGMAKIKLEYLIHDHVRSLNTEYLSKDDKRYHSKDGPPKKKFKGQNKHRPREARAPSHKKLCPYVIREEKCPFEEKCYYLHDVAAYISEQSPNISSECALFNKFGKCPQGVTCRFSSAHLTPEFKNVINDELWTKFKGGIRTKNALTKELQISLWKRKYNFDKANANVKALEKHLPNNLKADHDAALTSDKLKEADGPVGNIVPCDLDQGVTSPVCKSEPEIDCSTVDPVIQHMHVSGLPEHLKASLQTHKTFGTITDMDIVKMRPSEVKQIDFAGKLYLAPLTTVGNLPFRRICKKFGADITCGEMAMAQNLLQGQQSEWALLKRHESEDIFGVQLCGPYPDQMTRCAQLLMDNTDVNFVDINVGCPIELVYQKGAGCGLMGKLRRFEHMVYGMQSVMDVPLTVKIRTGIYEHKSTAHTLVPKLCKWGIAMTSMHGRSREQRYTKMADWSYIDKCAKLANPMPLFGCGDILSYEEANRHLQETSVSGIMIARGALIKPWIFTEIKEQRHWDISATERFEILQNFVHNGLEHWGSDTEGVEKTRTFLLEWLSFLYRYIPVGILEHVPQKINERPPYYHGRNDLETLMASPSCADWVKISERLLGPVPTGFTFLPKHKANSYT